MHRKLVLEFTKMNGAGNDFIVIDNRFFHFSGDELSELARRFCPRRIGIGADGLLAFSPAQDPRHHYRMQYYNADGSLGTMCGNGARCLARFARTAGVDEESLTFESDAGVLRAFAPDDLTAPIRLFVDPPRSFHAQIALATPPVQMGAIHSVWTGTEHLVTFVDDIEAAPVATWGPALRSDAALAPAGANVNFVQVVEGSGKRAKLRVRTFEKGVEEETLACGTGAIASAVTAFWTGHTETTEAEIQMPGGTLRVGFRSNDKAITHVYLEGPAEVVFRGTLEV